MKKRIKAFFRRHLREWLGIEEIEKERKACFSVDMGMKGDRGYIVIIQPSRGREICEVLEIAPHMTIADQVGLMKAVERWARGPVSLLDAPRPGMKEAILNELDKGGGW